jgi:hypothetical protein
MNSRLQLRIYLVGFCIALAVTASPAIVTAQLPAAPPKPVDQTSPPPKKPGDRISPSGKPGAQKVLPPDLDQKTIVKLKEKLPWSNAFQHFERQLGRVSLPVTRGVRLLVDNRTSGRITVHGWDRDVIEAHAVSDRGEEVVLFSQSEDDGPKAVFLKADYANLDNPTTPTAALELPPVGNDGPIQVHLEVNVPRYAELELIKVIRSNIEIIGVETPISIIGQEGNLTLKDVGSVEAHTRSGSIVVENARGIAELTSSTGKIDISNSRGAVRAVSITGAIEVKCVKGRVEAGNTSGLIELVGIDGDVEVIATSSDVRFKGPLRSDGRYYMKTMSGRIEMIMPSDTRGFNALLTSYRGKVESDFLLRPKPNVENSESAEHRLSGRFGNGGPEVTLDSFQGIVKLSKLGATPIPSCP